MAVLVAVLVLVHLVELLRFCCGGVLVVVLVRVLRRRGNNTQHTHARASIAAVTMSHRA